VDVSEHGIGGTRSHVGSCDGIKRHRGFEPIVLKVLVHYVVNVDQHEPHHVLHVLATHHLQAQSQGQQCHAITPIGVDHLGRAGTIELEHQLGEGSHLRPKRFVSPLVGRADAGTAKTVAIDG
jgi:hypothetical protein